MITPKWLDWDEGSISKDLSTVKKYKYTYGLKDIQIKYKEFDRASVYVSKPISVDGNVLELNLSSIEKNNIGESPNSGINTYDTSIEYYVSFSEYPDKNEWAPILPSGQEHIPNEVLFMNNGKSEPLRFQCDNKKQIDVYRNGTLLSRDSWIYCSDNSISIIKFYDKYAIYSLSYYPDIINFDPWNVAISSEDISNSIKEYISADGTIGELFPNGTDRNGMITLSKYPSIGSATIVSIENAKIMSGNKKVYNLVEPKPNGYSDASNVPVTVDRTDYSHPDKNIVLSAYNPVISGNKMTNPYFEYYRNGKNVFFTETFNNSNIVSNMPVNHGEGQIRIKYSYMETKLRVKIILRNTSSNSLSVTPTVNGYTLILKVAR